MISKEEIKKLADLARIEIKEEEQEELAKDMEAILEYVSQVKSVVASGGDNGFPSHQSRGGPREARGGVNVMREDENPTESSTHSKELIAEFPHKEKDYLKVKKILQ